MPSFDPRIARSACTRATVYLAMALLICIVYVIRKTLLVFVIASMFAYPIFCIRSSMPLSGVYPGNGVWLRSVCPSRFFSSS